MKKTGDEIFFKTIHERLYFIYKCRKTAGWVRHPVHIQSWGNVGGLSIFVWYYLRIDVSGRFNRYHSRNNEIITLSSNKNHIFFFIQVENLKLLSLIMSHSTNFHTYAPIMPCTTLFTMQCQFQQIFNSCSVLTNVVLMQLSWDPKINTVSAWSYSSSFFFFLHPYTFLSELHFAHVKQS